MFDHMYLCAFHSFKKIDPFISLNLHKSNKLFSCDFRAIATHVSSRKLATCAWVFSSDFCLSAFQRCAASPREIRVLFLSLSCSFLFFFLSEFDNSEGRPRFEAGVAMLVHSTTHAQLSILGMFEIKLE